MVIIHWVIRSDFVKILPLGNILILIFTQPFKVFFKKLSCSKENGTKTKDTFTTIVQTTRKLGVNIYHYIYDRISKKFGH
tara:strand:- start:415 stop:654 length:240 start_codon:yes stop_codon:yes gene_type:complete